MPSKTTIDRARRDMRRGNAPSTAAGEFVREEMEHVRRGKHGARSAKQAIAIGLSKARRAGVPLRPPKRGGVSDRTRRSAERAYTKGQQEHPGSIGQPSRPARRRSRATEGALKREPHSSASHSALSKQAHQAWARRRKSGTTTAESSGARGGRRTTRARRRTGKTRRRRA